MIPVILGGLSILAGASAARKQRKAAKLEQEGIRLQNIRARTQAIKEYRQARAQVLAGMVATGASPQSSAYLGIQGSLQSQVQENAAFSLQQESLGTRAASAQARAAKYGFLAQALQVGAGIAEGASKNRQVTLPPTPTVGTPNTPMTNISLNPSPFQVNQNR